MRRVAAKFVPKLLNCDQKPHRMNIANEMLDSVRDDPNLLQRVITGDEAGVVHHEFLPQGRTVNKEYYLQVMRNLREAIRQKCPDFQLEAAFIFANIASDGDFKYNATIVKLDILALICLYDIVENPPVSGKYAALKEWILQRFGRSRQVRTAQVSETKPIADQRPSIILVELSKTPPSQHGGPCTPNSNSLQHLEQTAFPRDMNITTTAR
ncbi:hypothetical protein LAZ67_9002139 [Cordylochernes scorpioides]|uniref:DUF7041 domain-containing protein n=1 Tax=Cordylochernes scorpioides TaxID=51811 RepID=A0ABY6KTK1_9ARAC|nr:hypothetical protein LAZ67_9002139 [Cordylochernes scorpioides]